MDNGENNFLKLINKRIVILRFFITLLIAFLIAIIAFVININIKHDILMNVLGRQQMLIQMISKDANRKLIIMTALADEDLFESEVSFNDKIAMLNEDIENSINEYEANFKSIKSGIIIDNDKTLNLTKSLNKTYFDYSIDKIESIDFSNSVRNIINNNQINLQTKESILFINTNNEELMINWNDMLQELLANQKQVANFYFIVAIIIFLIFVILIYVSFAQLYKYLIEPLNELYNGIKSFGVLKTSKNNHFSTKKELTPVINEMNSMFDKLNKLIELISNLNKDVSFDGILHYIYSSFSEFIPYSHIGIALLHDNEKILEASYGISDPSLNELPKRLAGIKAEISKTSLENIIINGTPRVINDLENYTKNNDAEYNIVLKEAGIKSSITLPLKINQKPVGIIFFSSIYKNTYKQEHIAFLEILSDSISISLNKTIFIDELLYSTLLALAKMAEARDEDTGDHLDRMKRYSSKIAEFLLEDHIYDDVITLNFIKDIERFSPMHDIGKVGIRDGILLKPGQLTDEEFAEMKKHTAYGAEVLRIAEGNIKKQSYSMFKMGIEITENHHEKWNGTGYPNKKSGFNIPLSARIVAVADVLDALTSKRPYKKAFPFEESFKLIVEGKGNHFDPKIIDSLIKHKDEIYKLFMSFKN